MKCFLVVCYLDHGGDTDRGPLFSNLEAAEAHIKNIHPSYNPGIEEFELDVLPYIPETICG